MMNILLLLAPFSVLLGLVAVGAFVWTLRTGQYDDVQGAAERILIDEPDPIPSPPTWSIPPQVKSREHESEPGPHILG